MIHYSRKSLPLPSEIPLWIFHFGRSPLEASLAWQIFGELLPKLGAEGILFAKPHYTHTHSSQKLKVRATRSFLD